MWTVAPPALLALGALACLGLTSPVPEASPAPATSCTFTDAAAAIQSKASCATITLSGITVPAGTTLDLTGLKTGTRVVFSGKTTFGYKEWNGPLVSLSGSNIQVVGAAGHVIDANGAMWWDGKGSNGGKTKPNFFNAHSLTNSVIKNLNVKNTPVQAFSISGATGLSLIDITLDNSAGDSGGGHNTDAFNVDSSTDIYISGANVKNQDDCLAINSGTNITFTRGTCSGGHGLSIGSVGGRSDNTVKTVRIDNSRVTNSLNGVRIKTVAGATGSVSDVRYAAIALSGITSYGIIIQQDYKNGAPTSTPTTGVPITGLTMQGVTGSVASSAIDVYILCGKGSCSGWTWSGVSVTGGKKSSKCQNVPSGAVC